jgi:hypothetical protein
MMIPPDMIIINVILIAGLSSVGHNDDRDDKKRVIRRRRNVWVIRAGKRPRKGEANHM